MADSEQQKTVLKTAAGIAGGAVLFSPVGMPIVHGIAGLAVASLGLIAAGSAIGAITDNIGNVLTPKKRHHEEHPDYVDDEE